MKKIFSFSSKNIALSSITTKLKGSLLSFSTLLSILSLALAPVVKAQRSFTGDGFGGRLWYQPVSKIEYGPRIGSAVVNGQLYMLSERGDYNPTIPPFSTVNAQGNPSTNIYDFVLPYAVSGYNNVKLISLGRAGGLIKNDGSAWVFGGDNMLKPGTATAFFAQTPIQVFSSDAYHVDAGASHVAFVKTDGTVWSVGYNAYGNFGTGTTNTTTLQTTPVQMPGITNAKRVIAFGSAHNSAATNADLLTRQATVVLKADGTVWVAGGGGNLVSNAANNSPTQVTGLSNIVDIKCGMYHCMALKDNGEVYSWGAKYYAPHGNGDLQGTGGYYHVPQKVQFPSGAPSIVAIETADEADVSYAIDENGQLWTWGYQNSAAIMGFPAGGSLIFPTITAKHVADIVTNGYISYLTRNSDYPADQSLWFTKRNVNSRMMVLSSNGGSPISYWNALNYNASEVVYPWHVAYPDEVGITGLTGSSTGGGGVTNTAVGTIDCSKTKIVTSPIQGTESDHTIFVSVNVTTAGNLTPITVTGSGMSIVADFSLTTASTGVKEFAIPVHYDGTALGSLDFTVGTAGTCTADLSGNNTKTVNMQVWTLDNCTLKPAAPKLK